jgi:glycosyltransferase involved in cell wall biosynthesis
MLWHSGCGDVHFIYPQKNVKAVFLYTELAEYFLACLNQLQKSGVEVHVVYWPVNKEAPFKFSFNPKIKFYSRNNFDRKSLKTLVSSLSPDVIYCSGWIDKDYLSVCREFKSSVPVIVGFDNQWKGSIKQRVAIAIANFTIHKYFTHCWVPGQPQYIYALKLGFKKEKILTGYYSANFEFFNTLYLSNLVSKQAKFPKRFIFVGRYYEFKGIKDLWEAFIQLQTDSPSEWELWCLGTGTVDPVKHPQIKHFGFVQPGEMEPFIRDTGVFILPSHFEPWGVVVHEFASAGFPIICSDEVGAASAFLKDRVNGYLYKSHDIGQLKARMRKIMNCSNEDLVNMGNESVKLASTLTPSIWANNLIRVIKHNM